MAPKARATLSAGGTKLVLPVNPYTANWGYQENAVSRDTIGGRVVQLLSVQITDLTIDSVAGSRTELQRVASKIAEIMDYHIRTSLPARFKVPSRAWDFQVYVTAMPQIGWEVASTTYPYSLTMVIDEDTTGVQSKKLEISALERLYKGIGYSKEVHGGDPKGFSKTVKTVLAASAGLGSNSGNATPATASGGSTNGITPAIHQVMAAMDVRFPGWSNGGTHVCKVSSGTDGYWSEHSWGNAVDIMTDQGKYNGQGNTIFHYLMSQYENGNLPICQILWQAKDQINGGSVYDHTNHIHITGNPPQNSRTYSPTPNTSNTSKPGKANCPDFPAAW